MLLVVVFVFQSIVSPFMMIPAFDDEDEYDDVPAEYKYSSKTTCGKQYCPTNNSTRLGNDTSSIGVLLQAKFVNNKTTANERSLCLFFVVFISYRCNSLNVNFLYYWTV